MKITYLNASDGGGHVEIQLAALGELTECAKMMPPILKTLKNCQKIVVVGVVVVKVYINCMSHNNHVLARNCWKIAENSSLSLLLLLSRFVLTVYLITSMFPFTEGWLHAQNIGPAA